MRLVTGSVVGMPVCGLCSTPCEGGGVTWESALGHGTHCNTRDQHLIYKSHAIALCLRSLGVRSIVPSIAVRPTGGSHEFFISDLRSYVLLVEMKD